MNFAELLAAIQARNGLRVKLTIEDATRGRRRRRTTQGVVKPALDHWTEITPDENGRLTFRLAAAEWYAIDPRLVSDAREEADGRLLRVEMHQMTWVIETFVDQRAR